MTTALTGPPSPDPPPAPIHSPRLDLVAIAPAVMDALIRGDRNAARALSGGLALDELVPTTPDALEFLIMRRDQVRKDPRWAPWSLRAIVLRERAAVVGFANFHGPPGVNDTGTPGAAEVGYEIWPAHRNAGFATETALALMEWAHREHGVTHFVSGVAPGNLPSLRVNQKLGFQPTGQVVDGEVIFWLEYRPVLATYVALLRAVNVGGRNRVAMADLRELIASLGFRDVRSWLQSGNLLFRGERAASDRLERLLTDAAAARMGLMTDFFVRTREEMEAVAAGNPFVEAALTDPAHVVVMFLREAPTAEATAALQGAISGREQLRVVGRHAYLVYPDGIGRSKLNAGLVEGRLETRGTARNWNTVLRLVALARD